MADGHHEVRTGEDVHLAELDRLGLVDVARRAQHTKQGVPIAAFELRPLVRVHGIFDGQLMQSKLGRDGSEFLLGRPIEPDPGQAAAGSKRVIHVSQLERFGRAPPVSVHRAIDDHRADGFRGLSSPPTTQPRVDRRRRQHAGARAIQAVPRGRRAMRRAVAAAAASSVEASKSRAIWVIGGAEPVRIVSTGRLPTLGSTRSCSLLDAHSRDVEHDHHFVAHEHAAARQSLLPGEAEVSAVDHGAGLEADALVAPWVLAGALHDGGH